MGLQQALGIHAAFTENLTRHTAQIPDSEVMGRMETHLFRLSALCRLSVSKTHPTVFVTVFNYLSCKLILRAKAPIRQ